MKSQTTIEYAAITSIILIIGVVAISLVFDIPDTIINVRDRSYSDYWEQADIGILSYAFNETNGTLILINNKQDAISIQNISIDSEIYPVELQLFPQQIGSVTIPHEVEETFELYVSFTYIVLANGRINGFSGEAPLIGNRQ